MPAQTDILMPSLPQVIDACTRFKQMEAKTVTHRQPG